MGNEDAEGKKMGIKLICSECRTEFSCEKGAELNTRCPNCDSWNVIIPTTMINGVPEYVKEEQQSLF